MAHAFADTRRSAVHVVEWQAMSYRRIWKTNLFASFLQPLMFLLGMGLGVGSLVNANSGSDGALGGVPYVGFIAPGLLATTTMMLSVNESTWPVLASFKWSRSYHAMAATPMEVSGIVIGHLAWIAIRCALAASLVAAAMAAFPDARSTGLPIAVLGATLCGLSFAAPTVALTAWRFDPSGRLFASLQRFVIVPLFLFGGAFYPVSQLPAAIRPIAYVTPLWHAVQLCRGATLHTLTAGAALGHVAYLVTVAVAGGVAAIRLFRWRLAE